jgi:hypothetical protein
MAYFQSPFLVDDDDDGDAVAALVVLTDAEDIPACANFVVGVVERVAADDANDGVVVAAQPADPGETVVAIRDGQIVGRDEVLTVDVVVVVVMARAVVGIAVAVVVGLVDSAYHHHLHTQDCCCCCCYYYCCCFHNYRAGDRSSWVVRNVSWEQLMVVAWMIVYPRPFRNYPVWQRLWWKMPSRKATGRY